jgi:ketosteroid isomerase-like protein
MNTLDVGNKLVSFCKQGKNQEAIEQLYAQDIVSIEPAGTPDMPAESKGLEAVRGKNKWFENKYTVNKVEVLGPFPNEDQFTVYFNFDTTDKETKKSMKMEEIALYTTKDGKIVREEFFAKTM